MTANASVLSIYYFIDLVKGNLFDPFCDLIVCLERKMYGMNILSEKEFRGGLCERHRILMNIEAMETYIDALVFQGFVGRYIACRQYFVAMMLAWFEEWDKAVLVARM